MSIGPQVEIPADELLALVNPDGLEVADIAAHALERLNEILTAVAEPRFECRTNREKVSTTVRTHSFWPVANWS